MIEKYYEEELRYLYESGRQFAKAHPDQARFLNIDAVGDRDPYVERLFEGFAFLAARIREKLDDSFPELSEGMIDLLWPHLQQEIPSVAMVEFKPRSGYLTETKPLPRGTELLSRPVGPDNAICTFTTTQEVPLNPLSLAKVEKHVDTKGKGTITFRFRLEPGITWPQVRLDPLRLYLHAEMPVAMALHELLTRHVVSAKVVYDDGGSGKEAAIEGLTAAVTPGGLSPAEALLPCDSRSYWGYALLLEYFAYPEKFLFVDLHGLDLEKFKSLESAPERLAVSLTLDCDFPRDRPFGTDTFRLFCSPAVNLFRRTTEPVPTKITENEYLVTADIQRPASFSTHSVVSVTGIDRVSGERSDYEPLHSFKGLQSVSGRSFTARYRRGFGKKRELVLTIGGRKSGGNAIAEENLSIEAYFTNGSLARDEIRENGIAFPGSDFPNAVSFTNITRPTLPCQPPDGEHRWTFLAHLGASYSSLASAERLKAFLALYNWSGSEGRQRRIGAIKEVSLEPSETLSRGSLVRGIRYRVTIEEAAFADLSDLHLFGEVLAAFFSHYVSINSQFTLEFSLRPSGHALTWESLRGKRWPM